MKNKFAALAATAGLALAATQAHATVFAGNWYLDELKTDDPGLVLAASAFSGSFNVNLAPSDGNPGNGNEEIAVVPLFALYTTESAINLDDVFVTGTAKLRFVFDLPDPNNGPTEVTGVTGGIPFTINKGYLDWNPGDLLDSNGKMTLNFGPLNDGVLSIYVNGGTFNGSNNQLSVSANFDWDHDATAVPEPATWALMIAGFGMAGAAMRRRRVFTV